MTTNTYSFRTANNIISGPDSISLLEKYAAQLNCEKAVILTDPGIVKAGLVEKPKEVLEAAGLHVDINANIVPEPPIDLVEQLYQELQSERYELVVGIGGGSSLDVAKILAVRFTNSCPVQDFMGTEKIEKPGLPSILIPTTAGTGSEVTPNAIVTLVDQGLKVGIVSQYFLPKVVVLDPLLTLNLPKPITAATGMDAFIHSLESYISNKANPISDTFALRSMQLISRSIRTAYHNGKNVEARHDMIVGSMLGGMALTAAGTAAVHALAYPLGGKFNVPHGVANSMLLLPVMEFNFDAIQPQLAEISDALGLTRGGSLAVKAEAALGELSSLINDLEIPRNLQKFGVFEDDLDDLAMAASKVTRLLGNNPKVMSVADIRNVYAKLL